MNAWDAKAQADFGGWVRRDPGLVRLLHQPVSQGRRAAGRLGYADRRHRAWRPRGRRRPAPDPEQRHYHRAPPRVRDHESVSRAGYCTAAVAKRTREVAGLILELYLHGLGRGDFDLALPARGDRQPPARDRGLLR
jgi:hypothetical protein